MDVPNVIYQFTCSCSSNYIGRTQHRLEDRVSQHVPQWILQGKTTRPRSNKTPDSAIARHLLQCGNRSEKPRECFKILHRGAFYTMNKILEALEIKRNKPDLCTQKEHLFTLKIPWGTVSF